MCCNYYNSHTLQFTEHGCNCSFCKDGQINSLDFASKSASILGSTTPAAQKVWKMQRGKSSEDHHWSTDGRRNQCCSFLHTRQRQRKGCWTQTQWCNQGQRIGQQPFDRCSLWRHATVWKVKVFAHTSTKANAADPVAGCWLGFPYCDLNLFCLEFKCPLGSWCTFRVQTDRVCERNVHVGRSLCWGAEMGWQKGEKKQQAQRSSACVFAPAVFPPSGAALWSMSEYILDNSVLYLNQRGPNVWLHFMQGKLS